MLKTYYLILGVGKDASLDLIKKQYRVLAMQYHPDKNPDNKESLLKFKLLSEAYLILSDSLKRQQYDRFGKSGINIPSFDDLFGHGFGFSTIFENIFNHRNHNPFGNQQHSERGLDIFINVLVNITDTLLNIEISKLILYRVKCSKCNGTKSLDGKVNKCNTCNGSGIIVRVTNMGNMVMQQQMTCNTCNGSGNIILNLCTLCTGTGSQTLKKVINITIPRGILNNVRMQINEAGNIDKDIPGNVFVLINVVNNSMFTRDNNNLVYNLPIEYYDLILGKTFKLNNISNELILIYIPSGTKQSIYVLNQGIYSILVNNGNSKGHLQINLECKIPSVLLINLKLIELLQSIKDNRNG